MNNEITLNEMKLQELEKKFHEENNKMIASNQPLISQLIKEILELKKIIKKE
jgi:hypothetical protein